MSLKRRDSKNRVLRVGEQQRSDGRYLYTYKGGDDKKHYVYSWTLEKTDKTPVGKRADLSLREKEKQIKKDIEDGVAYHGGDVTVMELVKKYINTRTGVKKSTKLGYRTVTRCLEKEGFSHKVISEIKRSDAKEFLIYLQNEKRKSYSTIHTIRGVLRPAFKMALDDDLIRKNPFDFPLADVIYDDSVKREGISREDEKRFLDFIEHDSHYSRYYEGMYILFNTGLRISEFCGLTLNDLDMVKKEIRVTHQLQRVGDMAYEIVTPKTDAGCRILPMTDEVYECFRRILKKRTMKKVKVEPLLTDEFGKIYTGFLYLDKNDMPKVALHWEKYFQFSVAKFNKLYKRQLPTITPHIARHTYCTKQARKNMNPKVLQYLMGHSGIEITLDGYTHLKFEDAKNEVERLKANEQ